MHSVEGLYGFTKDSPEERKKGDGFITNGAGAPDVFVRHSSIVSAGFKSLSESAGGV
jgi:hypothetical protein